MRVANTHGTPIGMIIEYTTASPNGVTQQFIRCADSSVTRLDVRSNGDVQNVNGTYGSALSDERLKTNIKNANSQWDDIKNINLINYKLLSEGENDFYRLGVTGQQVKEISPNLVGTRPPEPYEIKANPIFGTLYEEGDEIPEAEEGEPQKKIGDVKEEKEQVLFFKDSIFFWKCTKALQEAMARIETLETENTALEARVTALESA
jgi:hypothetical protein